MGHQVAKSGKAPKQRRARLWTGHRHDVKNMNRAPSGGWNQARETLRRVAQRTRDEQKSAAEWRGYCPMPTSAWVRFVTRHEARS